MSAFFKKKDCLKPSCSNMLCFINTYKNTCGKIGCEPTN